MIVDLPDTGTKAVIRRLYEVREAGGAVTLGRVLTLVVGVDDEADTEHAIEAANEASREHPCRVIVVVRHGSPGTWGLSRDTLQITGSALTSCSDGTHLRGNGDSRRPASAEVTATLHLGYGLW